MSYQHELRLLLQQLNNKNSTVDIVALCETFLTKKVEKLVNIPGYTLYCKNRTDHKGGGVGLLIRNGIHHCTWKDLDEFIERESEHLFIEITSKCGKKNYCWKFLSSSKYQPCQIYLSLRKCNIHYTNWQNRTRISLMHGP